MRTLVLGAGATGGYFGGRLAQAGRDVTFLVRPGRAARLAERGLRITSPDGETSLQPRVITEPDGHYDLVLVAVKSYSLETALSGLTPAVGPRTVVIPLLNGIRHIESLVRRFGADRAWGGVCMIHATLDEHGDVHQMSGLHRLAFGPLDAASLDDPAVVDHLAAVAETLTGAGFDARASTAIIQELWDKWILLATLGAATTLLRGSIGAINKAPGGSEFLHALAAETAAVAEAAGHPIRGKAAAMLEATIVTTEPTTSSMYRDLVQGLPVEAGAIVGDLVAEAAKHQVSVPLLAAAHTGLAVYSANL
ncbi:2-dehydropantoate 2-reductase [Actinoplanes philippinensis]|uniref:2-dehydropantoate 2-reductase n=1 Tax=Actinoplanes philippinensis TaxID=35752 RepID=A0A1I2F8I9_9ACTN|nr:ketopantoate reductase family protein [Actinoplanes philippinensis]GIE77566.1 2-dehydropantoate 2-reductase [Actinoplanes philippinensis]SFF01652.1 2-dehydropantoate 2-reductase [Actinoplanes philippinensis]